VEPQPPKKSVPAAVLAGLIFAGNAALAAAFTVKTGHPMFLYGVVFCVWAGVAYVRALLTGEDPELF